MEASMAKARARGRKRDANFVVLKASVNNTLGTLGAGTVIATTLIDVADDLRLVSADLTWAMRDHTAGEGPIEVGINSSNLTVAQIAEAIVASPTSRGDRIALERTGRPVRQAGQFSGAEVSENLANGQMVRTTLRFPLDQAQVLQVYARNNDGSALTTGTVVRCTGKIYARWT